MANLIKKYPDYINENFSRIEKIVDNLKRNNVRCTTCSQGSNTGLPFMHVIINNIEWALTTFKNKPEVKIESVLIEMSANPQKVDGGAFMLNTLKNKSSEYVNSIDKFEMKYLDGREFEADIGRIVNDKKHLSEYKSYVTQIWLNFSNSSSNIKQLKAYIISGESFDYTANMMKLQEVDNPTRFVREQFQKIFLKDNYKFYDEIRELEPKALLRFGISSKNEFAKTVSNLDSKIYANIIVE